MTDLIFAVLSAADDTPDIGPLLQGLAAVVTLLVLLFGIVWAGGVAKRSFSSKVADESIDQRDKHITGLENRMEFLEKTLKDMGGEMVRVTQMLHDRDVEVSRLTNLSDSQASEIRSLRLNMEAQIHEVHELKERAVKAETELEVVRRYSAPDAFYTLEAILKDVLEAIRDKGEPHA